MTETQPILVFTSHIAGKNARVSVYADRVEWLRPRAVSGAKLTAGILTGGMSLLATGVKNGKSGSEMIPVKNITSVSTRRDGLLNTFVSVITSGATVDFRVSHAEAVQVKDTLTQLILGSHPALAAPAGPPPSPVATIAAAEAQSGALPPVADLAAQLQQLAALRDAGVLTDEEFVAKKTEILARM